MGVDYAVGPITEEAKHWLHEQQIAFPDGPRRWPTPNELRSVLESFSGHAVSYRDTPGGWDAEIVHSEREHAGSMANIWVTEVTGPDTPARFSFHKPSLDLTLMILAKLSRVCGPLLLMEGSSGRAVVVTWDADVPQLIAHLGNPSHS